MDDKNGLVDVSCFFLVEDSGDSELDSESSMAVRQFQSTDMAMPIAAAGGGGGGGDEDDAESCSCDTISTERLNDEVILQLLDDNDDVDQDLIDSNDEDEEPSLVIDLCREVMDGMEDRLFWETCMAVGYP